MAEEELIHVSMTREAAESFKKALSYAEARVHRHSEETLSLGDQQKAELSAEWLRWGLGRIAFAEDSAPTPPVKEGRNPVAHGMPRKGPMTGGFRVS